jgi:hypothetical protein
LRRVRSARLRRSTIRTPTPTLGCGIAWFELFRGVIVADEKEDGLPDRVEVNSRPSLQGESTGLKTRHYREAASFLVRGLSQGGE